MDISVIKRLKEFRDNNPLYKDYITGVSEESNNIWVKNKLGKSAIVTIDDLEKGRLNIDLFNKEEVEYSKNNIPNAPKCVIDARNKQRIENYINNNPKIKDYITNIESNNISIKNELGKITTVTIDDLESGKFNIDEFISEKIETLNSEEDEEIETIDFEPVASIKKEEKKETLLDLYNAISTNDINKIDSILMSKFKNPDTGLLMSSKSIIDQVTNNSIIGAADCIKNNTKIPTEPSDFSIDGKIVSEINKSDEIVNKDKALKNYFVPVHIMLLAIQKKGDKTYDGKLDELKNQFSIKVDDRLRTITPPIKDEENQSIEQLSDEKSLKYVPPISATAGFADIFILTIIILVYAAIIVNLILKMK